MGDSDLVLKGGPPGFSAGFTSRPEEELPSWADSLSLDSCQSSSKSLSPVPPVISNSMSRGGAKKEFKKFHLPKAVPYSKGHIRYHNHHPHPHHHMSPNPKHVSQFLPLAKPTSDFASASSLSESGNENPLRVGFRKKVPSSSSHPRESLNFRCCPKESPPDPMSPLPSSLVVSATHPKDETSRWKGRSSSLVTSSGPTLAYQYPFPPIFLPSSKETREGPRDSSSVKSLISSINDFPPSSRVQRPELGKEDHLSSSGSGGEEGKGARGVVEGANGRYRKSHPPLYKLCVSRSSLSTSSSPPSSVSSTSSPPSTTSSSTTCSSLGSHPFSHFDHTPCSPSCSCSCCQRPKNPKTAAFITASSIYAQLLVVICLGLFTAKIATSMIPLVYFEGFYFYLYSMSLVFLFYVYTYLLHDEPSKDIQTKDGGVIGKKAKISETEKSHGSIFLRIGAICFGLGTMIYNGLELGTYFETPDSSGCNIPLLGINPILQATFTFAQMYFIFTFSRLAINKFKLIARMGIMHLVATNICVWIRTLGKETLDELGPMNVTTRGLHGCHQGDIMDGILKNVSPYLYPFIVEYSLIGAAFLYIMWSNIGRGGARGHSSSSSDHHSNQNHDSNPKSSHIEDQVALSQVNSPSGHNMAVASFPTVDNISSTNSLWTGALNGSTVNAASNQSLYSCLGSSKGLFSGFLFLVVSITSLIIFFVLIHHRSYQKLATVISELTHSALLIFTLLATIVAYIKIRRLKFQPGLNETPDSGLRDILLKVGAFGLFTYAFFGMIAGCTNLRSDEHLAVLFTNGLTILQVILQYLFISDVVCRRRVGQQQPGRQLITFLLISNLTLWIIYTFEMQKVEASPVQYQVYGHTNWGLIVRLTLPFCIFYRFHAAITLAEVWKNSYK